MVADHNQVLLVNEHVALLHIHADVPPRSFAVIMYCIDLPWREMGMRWSFTPVREQIGSISGQSSRLRDQGRYDPAILIMKKLLEIGWTGPGPAADRWKLDPTVGTSFPKSAVTKVLKSGLINLTPFKSLICWLLGDF
jgi:hypothetical protein